CTVGYGLATFQMHYFFGALYLFLINSIYICLATFIGIKMMKFKPVAVNDPQRARRVRRWVYIAAILCMLPSIYLTYSMLRQSRFEINASRFVADECVFPETHVLTSKAEWSRTEPTLSITLIGAPLPQDSLQLALSSKLRFYGLAGTHLTILQGNNVSVTPSSQGSVRDIFEMSQTTIARKQAVIDSLQQIINAAAMNDSVAGSLAPELRVVFPGVSSLSVSRSIFAQTSDGFLDTVNVALVRFSEPVPQARREELARYLEARLGMKNIRIVEIQN
ncbi:MAG: DUF389 domain-containing protein, partial [Muribaculaceae bacterium]|nr:DUF389 domain-containing protein [Muribaculaceae bacterium]